MLNYENNTQKYILNTTKFIERFEKLKSFSASEVYAEWSVETNIEEEISKTIIDGHVA